MNSTIRLATRQLALALAAMLPFAMAGTTAAAEAPAPTTSPDAGEPLQQLDEILVRGQRLSVEIADAEDQFYLLYNRLNKKPAYEMSCGQRSINPGSRITTRLCVPGFIADRYSYSAMSPVPVSLAFPASSCSSDFGSTFSTGGYCNHSGYIEPSPQAVLMERSNAWYQHMMKVIRSDARLSEMAGRLDVLHAEMKSVKHRYVDLTDARDRRPVKPNRGPRFL